MARRYWLLKTEPSVFSFDDLLRAPRKTAGWDGVRNYQARNFLRDMKVGDKVLFYASSAEPSGVTGLAEVSREARPEKDPAWSMVDIRFVRKFPEIVPLETLKKTRGLDMTRDNIDACGRIGIPTRHGSSCNPHCSRYPAGGRLQVLRVGLPRRHP